MGTYVVTGATKGIGYGAVRFLRNLDHEVINIDRDRGDISVDLGTPEGREKAIAAVKERCAGGIDGLILNAGIAHTEPPSRVLAINYFGVVTLAEGLFPLLRKRSGRCAVTASGGIAYLHSKRTKYYVDALLANCGDEARIAQLVDSFPPEGRGVYLSTKLALVRYVRRVAPAWAVAGVNLNAIAPGAVATSITVNTQNLTENEKKGLAQYKTIPMPTIYGKHDMMDPSDVGSALGMLVLPEMKGLSGAVLYCDGGTSSLLHPEKWY